MSALWMLLALWSGPAAAHAGHGPSEPWEACAASALGDACAWENAQRDLYRGTCRSMSGALVCVRKQPILRAADREPRSAAGVGIGVGLGLIGAVAWRRRRGLRVRQLWRSLLRERGSLV